MNGKKTHTHTHYRGLDNILVPKRYGLQLHHGYFRFGSGFMPVFVKLYDSFMVHGCYGSEKSRVCKRHGLTAVMYRGFETTVKTSDKYARYYII